MTYPEAEKTARSIDKLSWNGFGLPPDASAHERRYYRIREYLQESIGIISDGEMQELADMARTAFLRDCADAEAVGALSDVFQASEAACIKYNKSPSDESASEFVETVKKSLTSSDAYSYL